MNVKITSENYAQILESVRIKASDKYSTPPEVIHISDSTISTLGNFSASTGKGKSKKTFNVCAIVASALTGRRVLNYDAKFPEGKRKVLYFDTEQSSYHCHNVLERINRLAGLPINTDSDLIEFLMLREMDALDRRRFIELSLAQRSDIGLVIIDGLRDLLFDINSSSEAAEVIGLLMRWTSQYNIHIHTVLHLNKADDNVRGHIGTELNHKAETILQITKNENDGDISEVRASMIRDKEFMPFAFKINDEGLPEMVEGFDVKHGNNRKSFDYVNLSEELHRKALDKAFEEVKSPISYSPLLERLGIGYASIGYDRARNVQVKLLKFLMKTGMVNKIGKGYVYNKDYTYTPLSCDGCGLV